MTSRKDEILGSFSKKAVADAAPGEVEAADDDVYEWSGRRPYEAFKAVDRRQTRLRLRPLMLPWDQVKYQYLLHMPEDDRGTFLCLVFSFMVVVIKGKNLQPVSSAIGRENCSIIWAFNPAKFDKPTDSTAPYIESIDIRIETRSQAVQEAVAEMETAEN